MQKLCLLTFAAIATLSAQKPLSKEEQILIRLAKIEEQNHRILKILEEASAPDPLPKINVSKSPFLGQEDASVTVVEFTDLQCPFCSKFHQETFPALHDKFIATGKIKFVSRDLPLPMHQHAHQAAEAGRCAGEQGHFWEMRDWMQSNPESLDLLHLEEHAQAIDLDLEKYRICMTGAKYSDAVDQDAQIAKDLHISGTPAFIIGKSGTVVEGELIVGNQPLASFERAIKDKIAK